MDRHLEKYNQIKKFKLLSAVVIDLMGLASYVIPIVSESTDFIWGPMSGFLIFMLFPNRKGRAISGVLEEMIPFTDFIPSAYLTWRQEYIKEHEKTLNRFLDHRLAEDRIVSQRRIERK